jgi:starvation-inducible DNA-binding protein
MRPLNIGLTDEQREGVIKVLNNQLANAYLLIIKTKKYHWDVVGPQFRTIHEMLQEQYEQLAVTIDDIAERIRALGGYPIGTAEAFMKHATIKEHTGDLPSATEMVTRLVNDHETIIRSLRSGLEECEEKFNDSVTADFLSQITEDQEEMAWMLRSFIEGQPVNSSGDRPDSEIRPTVGV